MAVRTGRSQRPAFLPSEVGKVVLQGQREEGHRCQSAEKGPHGHREIL